MRALQVKRADRSSCVSDEPFSRRNFQIFFRRKSGEISCPIAMTTCAGTVFTWANRSLRNKYSETPNRWIACAPSVELTLPAVLILNPNLRAFARYCGAFHDLAGVKDPPQSLVGATEDVNIQEIKVLKKAKSMLLRRKCVPTRRRTYLSAYSYNRSSNPDEGASLGCQVGR